ncbi:hypothetical protein HAX54_037868, partial [Datura stramonium]|nr:hypothetical protein [Datura stramonium]
INIIYFHTGNTPVARSTTRGIGYGLWYPKRIIERAMTQGLGHGQWYPQIVINATIHGG